MRGGRETSDNRTRLPVARPSGGDVATNMCIDVVIKWLSRQVRGVLETEHLNDRRDVEAAWER